MCVYRQLLIRTPCSHQCEKSSVWWISSTMARDHQTSLPKHLKLFLKVTQTLWPLFVRVCALWRTSDGWLSCICRNLMGWAGRAVVFLMLWILGAVFVCLFRQCEAWLVELKNQIVLLSWVLEFVSHWSHFYLLSDCLAHSSLVWISLLSKQW